MEEFSLTYEGFDPQSEGLREVLTSTGNGRFCSRGAAEWEDADGVHYPGTYAHGVYNRETTILGGVPVLNEDLVNLPNWLVLKLRIEGGDAVRLADVELLDYRHELDLRRAVMTPLAALPRCRRPRDDAAQPPVREHGPSEPGRNRVDADRGELVGSGGGRLGDRRPGHQSRRRALPGARGPASRSGLAAHVRPRGDRAEGPDAPVRTCTSARRRGRECSPASSRWRWSAACTRPRTTSSRCSRSSSREGAPVRVEKMVALATSRDPATSDTLTKAGSRGAAGARTSRQALAATRRRLGGAVAGVRRARARR